MLPTLLLLLVAPRVITGDHHEVDPVGSFHTFHTTEPLLFFKNSRFVCRRKNFPLYLTF